MCNVCASSSNSYDSLCYCNLATDRIMNTNYLLKVKDKWLGLKVNKYNYIEETNTVRLDS